MPDLVCDTSALQYLHQLGALDLLQEMGDQVLVPASVQNEIEAGRQKGVDLPLLSHFPWLVVCSSEEELPVALVSDMGAGETAVILHTMKDTRRIAVLDDAMARARASNLKIPFTGTLGLLVDAKRKGLLTTITPLIEKLESLGFHLAAKTKVLILQKACERDQS